MSKKIVDINFTTTATKTALAIQQGFSTICNEGGSSSGKTYGEVGICIFLCADKNFRAALLSEKWAKMADKPLRISLVSPSLPHIKRGMLRDFKTQMENAKLWDEERWSATNFTYTFEDGSYIELFGLEDEGKARGPRRDILLLNEANLVSKTVYDQLAMRTTMFKMLDWNPADFNSWVYDLADQKDTKCIKSTYKDNIQNLTAEQVRFIESFKDLPDDFMWKVYGLGLRGASKEIIYTAWKKYTDEPPSGDVFYGLDFGYTNPSALVKVTHYEGSNYVEEVLYERGLTLSDLINRIKQMLPKNALIYADSAEPKSIEELYRAGFNVKPSEKDVWAGILSVKARPLYIHAKSVNLSNELQSYKWRKDKNDQIMEEPIKENDHLCDAMRYAIFTHLSKPKRAWI